MLIRRMMRSVLLTVVLAPAALPGSLLAAEQAGDLARGQEVYTAQKCQLCHALAGKGNKTNPLDGVGAKLTADDIRQWILHPVDMAAKTKSTKKPPMPNKYGSLPAADVDALVVYLQSLK